MKGFIMVFCSICKREFKKIKDLSRHIVIHNIEKSEYYNKYLNNTEAGYCKVCGKKTKFINLSYGFRKFCSTSCASRDPDNLEKCKNTWMLRYGVDNISKLDSIKNKKKATYLKNYGVDSPLKSEKIREKFKQTCLKNNGVDSPLKSQKIKNKIKETCKKRYNTDHVFKNPEIQKKRILSIINHFGVNHQSKSDIIKEKKKKTCIEKYGSSCYFKTEEFKSAFKFISKNKYGFDHPNKSNIVRMKISNSKILKKYKDLFINSKFIELIEPMFDKDKYIGIGTNEKGMGIRYSWKCIKCGNIFEDRLNNGHIPRCPKCFPIISNISLSEKEIYDFIYKYFPDTISNDRSILSGKELDIYIPSKNLAIEFNGLHWHSELQGKDKNYHLDKTTRCLEKEIHLIHIFEDEWLDKQEIVKSVLKAKLGIITNKIFARKCTIAEVSNKQILEFLNTNHIQGYIRGNNLGLYYKDELVSILVYGSSRYNKKYEFEILRFCNKIDTTVVGGLSRLLSKINSKSIITYVDRRYSVGKSYESVGFKFKGESNPSYYYIKGNELIRYNRIQFQKHKLKSKLESFDPSLTEWQNMQLNGYDRIWDCGNYVYDRII